MMEAFWLLSGFGVLFLCMNLGIAAVTWAEGQKKRKDDKDDKGEGKSCG